MLISVDTCIHIIRTDTRSAPKVRPWRMIYEIWNTKYVLCNMKYVMCNIKCEMWPIIKYAPKFRSWNGKKTPVQQCALLSICPSTSTAVHNLENEHGHRVCVGCRRVERKWNTHTLVVSLHLHPREMQALFFPIPFIIFPRLVLLPASRISDPGPQSRLPPPQPHSTYGTCLAFLSREGFSTFFRRRFASNSCAYPRYM